jgi:hypothetical protein
MIKLGLYEHYKGLKYEVIGICRNSETLEELVVYRALYGDYRMWVRPIEMFTSAIKINATTKQRFKFIEPLLSIAPKIH